LSGLKQLKLAKYRIPKREIKALVHFTFCHYKDMDSEQVILWWLP